jgi:hypothetical protein
MALQNLGSITNLQKMTGVLLKCEDINGNVVALPSAPDPIVDQQQSASIANVTKVPNQSPDGSQYTFDVVGGPNPSNGPVTITVQTHQANGDAGFSQQMQITITEDPSIPGPPAQFVVTPGTIAAQ